VGLFLHLKKASGSVNLKTNVKRVCLDDVLFCKMKSL